MMLDVLGCLVVIPTGNSTFLNTCKFELFETQFPPKTASFPLDYQQIDRKRLESGFPSSVMITARVAWVFHACKLLNNKKTTLQTDMESSAHS